MIAYAITFQVKTNDEDVSNCNHHLTFKQKKSLCTSDMLHCISNTTEDIRGFTNVDR